MKALTQDQHAGRVFRCASHSHWWRCLFEESEDAQLACRANGEIVEVNKKAVQLLGIDASTANQTHSVFEFLTPSLAGKFADCLAQGVERQQTLNSVTLIRKGLLSLLSDLRILPLDENHILVIIKDASRRWRMESHVQRLLTAVDSTPDVVFVTDADFRLTFVNSAFQTATGYTIEDALGKIVDFLRAPDQCPIIQQYLKQVQDGLDWKGELINVRTDGSVYPVEATISPIYDNEGRFLGYVALERDITEQKRLQDELRWERNALVSILNSLDSAVYTMDRQFRLSHVSEGCVKLPENHGWLTISEPPKPGSQLLDYVTDVERRSELRALFESVLENGKPKEIRAVQPNGNHWLMKVAPWQHQGEIRGLIYIVTDQTEFHALQTQLYQAQKMETIGTLAAGVAQDFNNLLQAIRGNVSLVLLDHQLPLALRNRLESVDEAAIRAAVITQQLLSFSQVSDEEGNLLDFNEVIVECGDLFKHSLSNKVELRLQPTSSPLKVRIDNTRAHRLLLNLFVNAQDAMPNGGQLTLTNQLVRLNATQAAIVGVPSGSNFVKCSVSDTGTGMPEDVVSRIFDPFFTTKAQGKSMGLGLFAVHSIATKADGFLEVESTVGRGTTFHIYLPSFEEKLPGDIPLTNLPASRASARVLVVDDLDLVLDFARSFLEASGYEVLVASSAEQALGILEKEPTPVHLLFTDYNMPGMSGRQLIHQAVARWPEMKFILTSGFLEDDDRQQIEKQYGARILDKPFNISEAAELISEMLAS